MTTSLRSVVVRRHHHLPSWLRWSRYTAGSAICFVISEVVLIALFGTHLLGAKGASIVASIAGVIPGYYLNRTWTWGRTGKSDFWREVAPYWVTALVSTLIAAFATGAVNNAVIDWSRGVRTIINAAAYMAIYGVLFIVKFWIFHRILFKPPPVGLTTSESASESATG